MKIKQELKWGSIGLLILFSLNRCTVACNRDTKIKKLELVQKQTRNSSDSLEKMYMKLQSDTTYYRDEIRKLSDTNDELLEKALQRRTIIYKK
jgi:spore germination protein GerM